MKNQRHILGLTMLAILFTILTIITISGNMLAFNNSIINMVRSLENPILTAIMVAISYIGGGIVYVPVAIILVLIPKTRVQIGVPVFTTLATSALLNLLLKNSIAIPRPDTHRLISEAGYGFPSGHVMTGTAFVGICLFLFLQHSHKQSGKILGTFGAILFLASMGFDRIYLGVHNPTDVLAGYLAGAFVCLLAILIIKILAGRNGPSSSIKY